MSSDVAFDLQRSHKGEITGYRELVPEVKYNSACMSPTDHILGGPSFLYR